MRFLSLCAIALVSTSLLSAGEAPATAGDSASAAARAARRAEGERRWAESQPELKGLDLESPEGKAKLAELRDKRAAEGVARMRRGFNDMQAEQRQEVKKEFASTDEEFAAIEPLLIKVETLRVQRAALDPSANPMASMMGRMGMGRGRQGGNATMMAQFVPEAERDPTLQEIHLATVALKGLLADPQANSPELTATIARIRTARTTFTTAFTKAQNDLRAVLTKRQEALLIDRGILE